MVSAESEDDDEFPITASTSPIISPARIRVPFDHDLFRAPELPVDVQVVSRDEETEQLAEAVVVLMQDPRSAECMLAEQRRRRLATVCHVCHSRDPKFVSTADAPSECPPVAVCSLICESRYIEEQGCEVVTATRARHQRGTKRSAARSHQWLM